MADPLSIAASVAGLLTLTTSITSSLKKFKAAVSDAPTSARIVLATVEETSIALKTVRHLIEFVEILPPQRKSLVHLDHLAIIFSQSIRTLSELEALITIPTNLRRRWKWTSDEMKVMRLMPHLESQKSSLSLIITVLRCKSDLEAVHNHDRLQESIESIAVQNDDLVERIRQLEAGFAQKAQSIRSARSELVPTTLRSLGDNNTTSVLYDTSIAEAGHFGHQRDIGWLLEREFEEQLEATQVYRRVKTNEIDTMSLRPSTLHTRFSILSRFSLNDISIVGLFRIPITLSDMETIGADLTFSTLLSQQSLHHAISILPRARFPGKPTLKLMIVGNGTTPRQLLFHYTKSGDPGLQNIDEDGHICFRVGEKQHVMDIFDTSGFEGYRMQLQPLYRDTDVFLVAVEIDNERTFEDAQTLWIPEITRGSPSTPYIVVGIKNSKLNPESSGISNNTRGLELVTANTSDSYENSNGPEGPDKY
ncbi:uncharacterized protein JN550_002834 [Neoarthrinium moseri]|uniref:uncharacterized protein n=1 Tax=Neoarthrinium moseri TaxID=1658444 RepID=UPI001FDE46BD|nr:uncharacterized protein JN550_002834 [Neoarthrinium moseri]KAI1874255.1 hypothetical protein JN550_002834 [Neoarthrinium moseri]